MPMMARITRINTEKMQIAKPIWRRLASAT